MKKAGHPLPFAQAVLLSVAFTTVCWVVTAFFSAPTSRERLIAFYRKMYPGGPSWRKLREEAGVSESEGPLHGDNIRQATPG